MDMARLLAILACPICHSSLEFMEDGGKRGFYCPQCKVVFPIEDEIPVMLPNAAVPVAQWTGKEKD